MSKECVKKVWSLNEVFESKKWDMPFEYSGYEWKLERLIYGNPDGTTKYCLCGYDVSYPEKLADVKTLRAVERVKNADIVAEVEWFDEPFKKIGNHLNACGAERMGRVLNMMLKKREEGYIHYTMKLHGARVTVIYEECA